MSPINDQRTRVTGDEERRTKHGAHFTLIEMIVVLVLVALVAAAVVPYVTQATINSARNLDQMEADADVQSVMEEMVADYKENHTSNLQPFKNDIGTEGNSYSNDYGDYYVVENEFIVFSGSPPTETTAGGGDPKNLLKVTILNQSQDSGEVTCLFTEE